MHAVSIQREPGIACGDREDGQGDEVLPRVSVKGKEPARVGDSCPRNQENPWQHVSEDAAELLGDIGDNAAALSATRFTHSSLPFWGLRLQAHVRPLVETWLASTAAR